MNRDDRQPHPPTPRAVDRRAPVPPPWRSAGPTWRRTAATWCASRGAGCSTRRWPKTWCTMCSRPWSPAARSFGGRSALRSWLVAILKHKIVDLVRQRVGHDSLDDGDDDGDGGSVLECPQPRPDEVAEQRQRLRQTLARSTTLPATLREVVRAARAARPERRHLPRWRSARRTCSSGCTARGGH